MNNSKKIIIGVAVIAVVAILVIILLNVNLNSSNLNIKSGADLSKLVDKIYAGVSIEMPSLETYEIDMSNEEQVKQFTNIENVGDLEAVVVLEPMMTSQAYSLVLVKVKDGVNANSIAKEMNENANPRKWICVTAEKVYIAASGDVVCLVMSNYETANAVFESFKNIAGGIKEENELVRTEEEPELPDEILLDQPVVM